MTLNKFIDANKKLGQSGLSEITVLHIFTQLLEGFQEMHDQGIVHRDIKSENIMIEEGSKRVKIIDLGEANYKKLMQTKGKGTPLYSPPETLSGNLIKDFKVDVWSLGMVLY